MVRVEHGALGTGRRILVARVVDIYIGVPNVYDFKLYVYTSKTQVVS